MAETQTFGTTTGDLLRLADWLTEGGCTHVGLESTGEFWKPVFNLLEGAFEVWLLNAAHIKAVPGRKTDVKDAQWIAELLAHGLVRPSFIPPRPQRELRDLTRYRATFVRERATLVNRVHKVLEGANLKLAAVATDIMGVSGRAILAALLAGEEDPVVLAELAKGPLRKKRPQLQQALRGHLRPHQSFVLTELLAQIDSLEESIARFTAQIAATCAHDADEAEVMALLDTIPGLSEATAQVIVAEIGADMPRFPSAQHLASWPGCVRATLRAAAAASVAGHATGTPGCGARWPRSPMWPAGRRAPLPCRPIPPHRRVPWQEPGGGGRRPLGPRRDRSQAHPLGALLRARSAGLRRARTRSRPAAARPPMERLGFAVTLEALPTPS